jgi:hypothetical protein
MFHSNVYYTELRIIILLTDKLLAKHAPEEQPVPSENIFLLSYDRKRDLN